MKTQIWNRTTIVWDANDFSDEFKTNIRITHWPKRAKMFYQLIDLKIFSNFNNDRSRTATIRMKITQFSSSSEDVRQEIIFRLMRLDKTILRVSSDDNFVGTFEIQYALQNRESFCDSAIKKAKEIFKVLGIKDKDKFILANFIPIQETLVKTKSDGWIPYGDYLRNKYKLPQACSLYNRAIRLDGDLIITVDYQKAESNFFLHANH
jgi:bisphosphoglycerate-independent phosphoglycerate mutase (AlkP superfamily)